MKGNDGHRLSSYNHFNFIAEIYLFCLPIPQALPLRSP